jgi:hypothetical protein
LAKLKRKKWDYLPAEARSFWDVHKERRKYQGRLNDGRGHAAIVGNPDATDVPEVDLEYACASDDDDDSDYEAATGPAAVAMAAVTNAAAANQAAAQTVHTAQAA